MYRRADSCRVDNELGRHTSILDSFDTTPVTRVPGGKGGEPTTCQRKASAGAKERAHTQGEETCSLRVLRNRYVVLLVAILPVVRAKVPVRFRNAQEYLDDVRCELRAGHALQFRTDGGIGE